ncbi:MAG: 4-hydroxythreonine-4-phosphate dehydrogenase PdxA [Rhodocyclaceae bacterium]|nr:4-hydroxythreonine-4-phosphate dehydrogenase PdxA [Rhodocyclaceae bacterium]
MDAEVRLAITIGEPAGIGPEICLALAGTVRPARLVLIGSRAVLEARAALQRTTVKLVDHQPDQPPPGGGALEVIDVPLAAPVAVGQPDARNASAVLRSLDIAIDGCLSGDFDAMVTAPLHKGVICDSGVVFSGHTEYLEQRTGADGVVMLLEGGGLRVALATTHLPLRDVPAAITRDGLLRTLRILHRDLVQRFDIATPRILVAGLNPHAGEGGHLGREEIDVITPALDLARSEGIAAEGPFPADTLFVEDMCGAADAVLAMYHDQGLPVLKRASFGHGVNISLGLPMIRTSVDHGTALAIAGTGSADPGSLVSAVEAASRLVRASRRKPAQDCSQSAA